MTRLQRALIELEADLRALDVDWALIGGLAVAVRAEPRQTRDLDIAVAVQDDGEAEHLFRDLVSRGYRQFQNPLEQEDVGRLATIRLESLAAGVVIDVMCASSGVESEIVAAADLVELFDEFSAPVARTGHLLALKALAGREIDHFDFRNLLAESTERDVALARETVELIERRGYSRAKPLRGELERLLRGESEEGS